MNRQAYERMLAAGGIISPNEIDRQVRRRARTKWTLIVLAVGALVFVAFLIFSRVAFGATDTPPARRRVCPVGQVARWQTSRSGVFSLVCKRVAR